MTLPAVAVTQDSLLHWRWERACGGRAGGPECRDCTSFAASPPREPPGSPRGRAATFLLDARAKLAWFWRMLSVANGRRGRSSTRASTASIQCSRERIRTGSTLRCRFLAPTFPAPRDRVVAALDRCQEDLDVEFKGQKLGGPKHKIVLTLWTWQH
jgi:hypothetical protein